jgi:RNase H-like domain found in reverse transcriptase
LAIATFPQPKNRKEAESFVGLVNYWQGKGFIDDGTNKLAPIRKCLEGKWNQQQFLNMGLSAFEDLKKELLSKVSRTVPDFSQPFIIYGDFGGKQIAYTDTQIQYGQEVPVAMGSRVTTQAERSGSELGELSCLLYALDAHSSWHLGQKQTYAIEDQEGLTRVVQGLKKIKKTFNKTEQEC